MFKLIRLIGVFFITGCFFTQANAQTPALSFKEEMSFMEYLVKQEQYANVILLGQQLRHRFKQINQQNRLALEIGFAHDYLKKTDSAAHYFSLISSDFAQYDKARFYQSLKLTQLRQYDAAQTAIRELNINQADSLKTELREFQMAGIALLKKDYKQFDQKSLAFSFQYPAFASQEKKLLTFADKLKKIPRRSPFVAGLFSAIVPGTGKIYAGKSRQGLNMLFQNLFLGAQATEALLKDGVTSPRFIIYGALFSFFYIGNIWGSVLSVKMQKREVYETVRHEVLFNLDVPLRLVFQ